MTYTTVAAMLDTKDLAARLKCEKRPENGKIILCIGPDIVIWLTDDADVLKIAECLDAYLGVKGLSILCQRCSSGKIMDCDGQEQNCPVCDGDPMIDFKTVERYAKQIDDYSREVLQLRSRVATLEREADA